MIAVPIRKISKISGRIEKIALAIPPLMAPGLFIADSIFADDDETIVFRQRQGRIVATELIGVAFDASIRIQSHFRRTRPHQNRRAVFGDFPAHQRLLAVDRNFIPGIAEIAALLDVAAQTESEQTVLLLKEAEHGSGIGEAECFPGLALIDAAEAVTPLGGDHQAVGIDLNDRIEMAFTEFVTPEIGIRPGVDVLAVLKFVGYRLDIALGTDQTGPVDRLRGDPISQATRRPVDAAVAGRHEATVRTDRESLIWIEEQYVEQRFLGLGLEMLNEPGLSGVRTGNDGRIVSYGPEPSTELCHTRQCRLHRYRAGLAPITTVVG